MLKSRMPTFILELLEESVGNRHIGLGELAVLAATVEDLVHGDTIELLRAAYKTHGLSVHGPLASSEQEQLVIKTYLLYFLLPWAQDSKDNSTAVLELLAEAPDVYPGWHDTVLWVADLRESIKYQTRGEHIPFASRDVYFRDFAWMSHLAEKFIDGIGMFQNIECKMIKNMLLDLNQERNDGRVLLTKFWGPYMKDEHYYFTETAAYLKHLGALDDADPQRPNVIVPNVLYGRSNCLATSSGFHSICCVDQCDALLEALEHDIAHPVASPALVANLVAALPSDTVAAPRNLSGSLRRKLDMIAAQHGGHVPLHGRMFAQFMHHAFPNECPFPRAPGGEAPLSHDEWNERTGSDSTATEEELQRFAAWANASGPDAAGAPELDEVAMLWTGEEELLTALEFKMLPGQQPGLGAGGGVLLCLLRCLAMACAGCATVATFWDALRSSVSLARPQQGKDDRCCSLPRWFGEFSGAGTSRSCYI